MRPARVERTIPGRDGAYLERGGVVSEDPQHQTVKAVPGAAPSSALKGRQVGWAAVLLAGSVLLSRLLGFVREMVLADRQGIGSSTDAFSAAFQIPDILNYLLAGGALAIAFTPLYLKKLQEEGEESSTALFHSVLGSLGIVTVVLTAALWWQAPAVIDWQFSDFGPETRNLTVRLTRIVLPAQVFFVLGGITRAVLMAHGRFGAQAAAPLLYNGGIIVGGLAGSGIEGFAWGALGGAFVGAFCVPLWQIRSVVPLGLRWAPLDPAFRSYLLAALPLMLGLSLTTVDEWYERWFGQAIGVGVLASLAYARRLMMAPVAVLGQAVATAALPTLASLHAEGRPEALNQLLGRTLRLTLLGAMLLSGGLMVLASPIVRVLYERGAFSAEDSVRVSVLLGILAWAVPGWVSQQVAVRAFFARGEMWRPMLIGTGLALLALPLYAWATQYWAAPGLAMAGVVAISINAGVTVGWARVRFEGPRLAPVGGTILRGLVITGAAAMAASYWAPVSTGFWGALLELAVGGGLYGAVAALGLIVLGDREAKQGLKGILSRRRKRSGA